MRASVLLYTEWVAELRRLLRLDFAHLEVRMTQAPLPPLAQQLLDAQVDWTLQRLQGAQLEQEIRRLCRRLMEHGSALRLRDLVKTKDVQAVALKYASEVQFGPLIPELVGEVARQLYDHKVHSKTRLQDLFSDRTIEELLDKVHELKTLRESIAKHTVGNQVFADMIAELLQMAIRDYVRKGSDFSERIPGAKSALKLGRRVMERARPDINEVLDDNLRQFIQKQTQASLVASERLLLQAIESDEVRQALLDAWEDNKHRTLSEIRDYAGKLDVEEFFVIGYEYWLKLRQSPLFRELVSAGVGAVMKRLGPMSVADLLADIGIQEEMIVEDALRFAPGIIAALEKKGLLQSIVREELEPFYRSEAATAIFGAPPNS